MISNGALVCFTCTWYRIYANHPCFITWNITAHFIATCKQKSSNHGHHQLVFFLGTLYKWPGNQYRQPDNKQQCIKFTPWKAGGEKKKNTDCKLCASVHVFCSSLRCWEAVVRVSKPEYMGTMWWISYACKTTNWSATALLCHWKQMLHAVMYACGAGEQEQAQAARHYIKMISNSNAKDNKQCLSFMKRCENILIIRWLGFVLSLFFEWFGGRGSASMMQELPNRCYDFKCHIF